MAAGTNESLTWKPATSTWGVLAPLSIMTATLLVPVVVSVQQYLKNGVLHAVADSPTKANAVFQYLPVLVGVLYGGIWGWIDLDTKRLAAWSEFAKGGWSLGRDSILLQYSTDMALSRLGDYS